MSVLASSFHLRAGRVENPIHHSALAKVIPELTRGAGPAERSVVGDDAGDGRAVQRHGALRTQLLSVVALQRPVPDDGACADTNTAALQRDMCHRRGWRNRHFKLKISRSVSTIPFC